jgi:hypothetical protein
MQVWQEPRNAILSSPSNLQRFFTHTHTHTHTDELIPSHTHGFTHKCAGSLRDLHAQTRVYTWYASITEARQVPAAPTKKATRRRPAAACPRSNHGNAIAALRLPHPLKHLVCMHTQHRDVLVMRRVSRVCVRGWKMPTNTWHTNCPVPQHTTHCDCFSGG